MALIADCNVETAVLDGWVTATTDNVPVTNTVEGVEEVVFGNATFTSRITDGNSIIQKCEGVDEPLNSTTTEYTRVSSTAMGHVLGTDWTEWLKTS